LNGTLAFVCNKSLTPGGSRAEERRQRAVARKARVSPKSHVIGKSKTLTDEHG
jgi:hypothetical protein